ncbi:2-C-methyl-D-erythritol 4-phosphate cytidylyltransferase [bacterium]|nr:MAG: 2-C-methyl-D-erythritol 4-phosphate cytidylyltransferase [bacterium]
MNYYAIIPASGSGVRFKDKIPKQFIKFDGKEVIAHTLLKFQSIPAIKSIVIASQYRFFKRIISIISTYNITKVKAIVEGGAERQNSVYNALRYLDCRKNDVVLVHDAVRPFVSPNLIKRLIAASGKNSAVIPGLKISDTVKKADFNSIVLETVQREGLWLVQTPQAVRYDILIKSFEKAFSDNYIGTDEASLLEYSGFRVRIINGEKSNIKITTKEDLII